VSLNAFVKDTLDITTEVFPKGHNTDSMGNFVWLPLYPSNDELGLGIAEGRTVFIDDSGNPYTDQYDFLKLVERVREDTFSNFITKYKLPIKEQAEPTAEVLESGTADLSKVRACSFMKHCENNAANLPEPLWYAWITNAIHCRGGREYIHEYSSQHPGYSQRETNWKITHALRDSGPMTHVVIGILGYKCDCAGKFKSPISQSTYIDVQAEAVRLAALADLDEKSAGIKQLVRYISKLEPIDEALARGVVRKKLKLPESIFKKPDTVQVLAKGTDYSKDSLTEILEMMKFGGAEDVERAMAVYQWFKAHENAQYFADENGRHYIYLQHKLIPIAEQSNDFQALLLRTGEISIVTQFGRIVTQVMRATAHSQGRRIHRNVWLETKESELTIYLNLKNEQNQLLKISPESCTLIDNGDECERVLMLDTQEDKLKLIQFLQLNDEGLKAALDTAEDLVVRHIPCIDHEKWFAYAWRLSYPLYDFTTMHLTLRAQGKQSEGKSTACKVLTLSLYGEMYENNNTVASLYSDACMNPLIVEDNLENRRFYSETGHADFYLSAATGGGKQKRDTSTDSGLVIEKIRSLLLCNGIESIAKSEQTSRMMLIECNRSKYNSGYTSAVLLDIKRHRDEMLSANYILTQRVLRRMRDGDWGKIQERLLRDSPDHPKSRMYEQHLSIMILYLEEMFRAMGKRENVWDLLKEWMESQKDSAVTEIIQSDPIIQVLDIIKDSAWKQMEYDDMYGSDEGKRERSQVIKLDVRTLLSNVSFGREAFSIRGKAGELLSAFSLAYEKHLGKSFPIDKSIIDNFSGHTTPSCLLQHHHRN
jgi:hypothetical protein